MKNLLVIALLAMLVAVLPAMAQEPAHQDGRPQVRRAPGERGVPGQPGMDHLDPAATAVRQLERFKNVTNPTEEQWKALKPAIEAVQLAQRDLRAGLGLRRVGLRPAPVEGQEPEKEPELTGVAKAVEELRAVLGKEDDEQIKEKLTALRAAKDAAQKKLTDAQDALKKLATPKQEAYLVMFGLLE